VDRAALVVLIQLFRHPNNVSHLRKYDEWNLNGDFFINFLKMGGNHRTIVSIDGSRPSRPEFNIRVPKKYAEKIVDVAKVNQQPP